VTRRERHHERHRLVGIFRPRKPEHTHGDEMAPDETVSRRTLMEIDPPQHTALRHLVNRGFARKLIETHEPEVRALAVEVVDTALNKTEFDFVSAIAKPLPMRMLGRILGTPPDDAEWLAEKGDQLIGNSDPDFTDHVIDRSDTEAFRLMPFRSPAGQELFDYAARQAELRRQNPSDDVISLLLEPMKDGTMLTDLEFKNFFTLLASAGNDTTRYTITAAVHAIANQPELLVRLRNAGDELWDTAVEEFIRWASVTMHFRRTATRDIEIHNKIIKAGDKVVLWFISGNRDASVFDNPYAIDLARKPNPHMAFGRGGPHACIGMWLARLQLRAVLQHLVKRVQHIEQIEPESRLRSNFINGIKRMPVAVQPR
ncbi:MAG: cytochrome P450, partial [Gammaproteobacteria bacterium]